MCGRFYIDEDMKEDLNQMIKDLNQKLKDKQAFQAGEVFPANYAAVLTKEPERIEVVKWGYPKWKSSSVVFNARSETALQKRMFENGFVNHRCLVPVSGFFEWDERKVKYYFKLAEKKRMYLAGIMDYFDGQACFTILTREADDVMKPVHSRMPVIIGEENADRWLQSLNEAKKMVLSPQALLERKVQNDVRKDEETEYEQIHIFNTFDL